jgi:cytochrome P450
MQQARHDADSDIEARRNRSFGVGLVNDPYPRFHDVRSECPVADGAVSDNFPELSGAERASLPDADRVVAAYSHETVAEIFRRNDDFSSTAFYADLSASIGRSVIAMDEPEHRRMRLLLQPAFSRQQMQTWKRSIIQPVVDEHIDQIATRGRADLHGEVGANVPVHVIASALGLPVEARKEFFQLSATMTSVVLPLEDRLRAARRIAGYVQRIAQARRADGGNDLIGLLVAARVPADEATDGVDDRPLSDEEIETFVRLLVAAGSATTYRAYGVLMFHLLHNPSVLAEVRDNATLRDAAIEESLRIDPPSVILGRFATRDTSIDGTEVPSGARVEVCIGAANHDPRQWADPEVFDPHREHGERHLSFGFGVHRCLGIHLARAELRVLLDQTLDRLHDLRLDPDQPEVAVTGVGLRLVPRLPVRFRPT